MIKVILATIRKNFETKHRAYPWTMILGRIIGGISGLILPYLVYVFLFNQNVSERFVSYTGSMNYITYIVLGSAIQILGCATLFNVGRALITEVREGTFEGLLLSRASKIGYLIGCYIEQMIDSSLQFIVIILFGVLLGANIQNIFTVQSIITLLITSFSFFSISILLSSIMLYTRDTYISQNTLFSAMGLLCGVVYPIEYLPNYLQVISNIIPMTPALKLFRNVVMSGVAISDNMYLIINIIVLSILYIIVGSIIYIFVEKKLSENILA